MRGYGTIWYDVIRYGTMKYSTICCVTICYNMIRCNMIQSDTVQYDFDTVRHVQNQLNKMCSQFVLQQGHRGRRPALQT